MNLSPGDAERGVARFRVRLMGAMALVVVTLVASVWYLADRQAELEMQRDLTHDFESALQLIKTVHGLRHTVVSERCRAMVRKPRIHAALEDDALDLLYPSAHDDMAELMGVPTDTNTPDPNAALFYRFLGPNGKALPPAESHPASGALSEYESARLALPSLPTQQESGYLWRDNGEISEVIATPIVSMETGNPISTLIVGFPPILPESAHDEVKLRIGLLVEDRAYVPMLSAEDRDRLATTVRERIKNPATNTGAFTLTLGGEPHSVFVHAVNGSPMYPPVYEIGIFSMKEFLDRRREMNWQALAVCTVLLAAGIAASHFLSSRLATPVRELARVSVENRVLRKRAEEALEITNRELERSARFSADASHQLKTPVAVLRAGLEELAATENVPESVQEEAQLLIHQTYRLTSIIEDLLLLSRLDAGHLRMDAQPTDLTHLVETSIDDVELASNDSDLRIEMELPAALFISGEPRYTSIIVQNLLENAHKYNRPGGLIRVSASTNDRFLSLKVGNTGASIPPEATQHIFERFHRAASRENIPGHGLGLNLARELARLHGGDLKLNRSHDDWTEFEATFPLAPSTLPTHITAA